MTVKGRSPNMRHITRTHRVDLDWLFERLRDDPGIFITYVNTKEQVADMLTKGSFTADTWNRLCFLANIHDPFPILAPSRAMTCQEEETQIYTAFLARFSSLEPSTCLNVETLSEPDSEDSDSDSLVEFGAMTPHGSSYTWAYEEWHTPPSIPNPYETIELAQQMGSLGLDQSEGEPPSNKSYLQKTLSPRTREQITRGPGAWLYRAV